METNKKLVGVFIKQTPENRQELKAFWEANSERAKMLNYDYTLSGQYYGLTTKGEYGACINPHQLEQDCKILTLEEAKALVNEYPKVMWVWDEGEDKKKRVVFMKKKADILLGLIPKQ